MPENSQILTKNDPDFGLRWPQTPFTRKKEAQMLNFI